MSLTANVAPTLGSAPVSLQAGNYGAIDDRRFWGSVASEGVLSGGSYNVTTTLSGMGLSVAASTGDGAIVQGDSVTGQGKYFVPPSSGALTVTAATADATNPRNDLVVLEIKDDAHDASGLNLARVRIVTGTPNGSAAVGDGPGTNGAAALPSSCLLLATVCVQAGSSTIAANRIRDRRNWTGGVPERVTSLPSLAANGQEIYFQASSTIGAVWHLRFRNQADGGNATYPWEFVGGSPLIGQENSSETTTSSTLTATGFTSITQTTPSGVQGDYLITWGCNGTNATAANHQMAISIAGAAPDTNAGIASSTVGAGFNAAIGRTIRATGIAASSAIEARYAVSAGTGTFRWRHLTVVPIRVGP